MQPEAVKLAAEIYARITSGLALNTQQFEADPESGKLATREHRFAGDNFTEHDLRPVAQYALRAARAFAEAYVDSLQR